MPAASSRALPSRSVFIDAGADPSIGSLGEGYDNALAETTIGLYKTELINRRGPWKTIDQVELATLEWVDW
jgi:putative transposase